MRFLQGFPSALVLKVRVWIAGSRSSIPPHFGDFLAGFLDAEAHLGIAEMNGGTSLSCFASVKVRDDDAEILEWLAAWTGLGSLHAVSARAASRRQVCWTIKRRDECVELGRLLHAFPLRSRKARESEIWREAVGLWCSAGAARRDRLAAKRRQLRRARMFVAPSPVDISVPFRDEVPLAYLAAFVAGEGHFGIFRDVPRLVVKTRADDAPLLRALAGATGLGRVYDYPNRSGANPITASVVYRRAEVREIAQRLCQVAIPGRKGREISAWRVAVEGLTRPELRLRDAQEMRRAVAAHRAARAYPGPRTEPLPPFGRRNRRAAAVAALRAGVRSRPGASHPGITRAGGSVDPRRRTATRSRRRSGPGTPRSTPPASALARLASRGAGGRVHRTFAERASSRRYRAASASWAGCRASATTRPGGAASRVFQPPPRCTARSRAGTTWCVRPAGSRVTASFAPRARWSGHAPTANLPCGARHRALRRRAGAGRRRRQGRLARRVPVRRAHPDRPCLPVHRDARDAHARRHRGALRLDRSRRRGQRARRPAGAADRGQRRRIPDAVHEPDRRLQLRRRAAHRQGRLREPRLARPGQRRP